MLTIRATMKGSPRAVADEFRRALRAELAETGRRWHGTMLPGHFEIAAEKKYAYKPRTKGYSIYKAKRFGHRRPLVFSGAMERQLRQAARVTSTSKGVRVALTGPKYLFAYRKDYQQADKAAEITATTDAEAQALSEKLDASMTRRLAAVQTAEALT